MNSLIHLPFLIGMAFLFVHELDAIQHHEWRFFFSLLPLSDITAYRIFTTAHIPLFVLIMWNAHILWFQIGFDVFFTIHAGLHWILRNHPKIKFNNGFSQLWIFGAALFGLIHLGLLR